MLSARDHSRGLPILNAVGKESVSRAVKMILLCNQQLEKEGQSGICVRPQQTLRKLPAREGVEARVEGETWVTVLDVFSL